MSQTPVELLKRFLDINLKHGYEFATNEPELFQDIVAAVANGEKPTTGARKAVKRILKLQEKHGDHYLDVSTDEMLHAVALQVVRKRFGPGGIYAAYIDPGTPPVAPDFGKTKAEIEAMPDSRTKTLMLQELKHHEHEMRSYKQAVDQKKLADRCLAGNDVKAACTLLQWRSDMEYEKVEIIHVSDSYMP